VRHEQHAADIEDDCIHCALQPNRVSNNTASAAHAPVSLDYPSV
jgi:hypothetical protein